MQQKRQSRLIKAPVFKDVWLALKSLKTGTASEEQQRLALDWIVNSASGRNILSFTPGDRSMTDFFEGQRSVGIQIEDALLMTADDFKQTKQS